MVTRRRLLRLTILNQLSVQTFIANANGADMLPTSAYLHIIVEGAREHGLPTEYCERLASLKTVD
jgi:hypothetical protein